MKFLRRSVLPVAVFATVMGLHYTWIGFSFDRECSRSASDVCYGLSWWAAYVKPQNYWLGYSYGLSLSFAAVVLRQYWEQRMRAIRNWAIGGVTLSGFLTVAGCFLAGGCGSPMLGVYLNLFGASFLPFAKPLMASVTTFTIGASWWWMRRRGKALAKSSKAKDCQDNCGVGGKSKT